MNFKRRLLVFHFLLDGRDGEQHCSGDEYHASSKVEASVIVPDVVIQSTCGQGPGLDNLFNLKFARNIYQLLEVQ